MQRQKPPAIPSDVQAVAKALRKKEGGADEALRLVEHLPDKEALELLFGGAAYGQQRLIAFNLLLLGLLLLSVFAWISLLFGTISRSHLSFQRQVILILLLFCPPLLALLGTLFQPREEKNLDAVLSEYVPRVQQTTTVETLLRYLSRPLIPADTKQRCWAAVLPLLSRFSDEEACALSPESCDFLHRLVATRDKRLSSLSNSDKISILLVLAARREESTRKLLEAQRVYPALREAAQSILEDW